MQEAVGAPGRTCILVHLSNTLMSDALKTYLAAHLPGYAFATPGEAKVQELLPALILVDGASVADCLHEDYSGARTLVVDTRLEKHDILRLIEQHRIAGVIATDSSLFLLEKALSSILADDLWFGRDIVQALLSRHICLRGERSSDEGHAFLSSREKGVIRLICDGCTNKEIAVQLGLSEQTIKAHLNRIFKKLKVTNRAQLVAMCARRDLL